MVKFVGIHFHASKKSGCCHGRSWNSAALRRFPERIPIFAFQHDGVGLRGGLQTFEFVRADDRQRLTGVRKNPGVGQLFQRHPAVTGRHAFRGLRQTRGGGIAEIKYSPTGERTPRHRQHAQLLALMKRAVVDWLRVQEVKLNLIRHERFSVSDEAGADSGWGDRG